MLLVQRSLLILPTQDPSLFYVLSTYELPKSSQGCYELDSFHLFVTGGETEAQKAKLAIQHHQSVGGEAWGTRANRSWVCVINQKHVGLSGWTGAEKHSKWGECQAKAWYLGPS